MLAAAEVSRSRLLVILLAGLSMLGPFSIDTIFPAFPQIAGDLRVGGLAVQQTISLYMLAFALMALWHGPLSDAYGRRPVILVCLGVFVLASVGCALSVSLPQLLLCRALQGFSAGAGLIVGRAIIRDRFAGAAAQRVMSSVTMLFALAPAIAPIIGGWIVSHTRWPVIFWMLTLFGLLLLLACALCLRESHPPAARLSLVPARLLQRYGVMLRHRNFLWLALSASFNFSALFLFIASAPAIVLDILRLGPGDFGYLFVPVIGGILLGAYASGRLAGHRSPQATVNLAYGLMLSGAGGNVLYCLSVGSVAWPWAVLPIMVQGAGMSLAFPTLSLLMLDQYPNERGAASSLQSFLQLMLSAAVAGLLSPALSGSAATLALGALACVVLGAGAWVMAKRAGVALALSNA